MAVRPPSPACYAVASLFCGGAAAVWYLTRLARQMTEKNRALQMTQALRKLCEVGCTPLLLSVVEAAADAWS